jgi:hypothetical protein
VSGVLALALRRRALSRGTVPSAVPVGHSFDSGTTGTSGTVGTVGTRGTVPTTPSDYDPVNIGAIGHSWSGDDWRAFFDERAGIAEFDGGLPREQAEARAFTCCVTEWLNRNPVRSSPESCLLCGEAEQGHDPLLPFGTESIGHAWLHSRCWSTWYAARQAEGVAALEAWPSRHPPSFQTISINMEGRDGRLRIGTAGRSRQG